MLSHCPKEYLGFSTVCLGVRYVVQKISRFSWVGGPREEHPHLNRFIRCRGTSCSAHICDKLNEFCRSVPKLSKLLTNNITGKFRWIFSQLTPHNQKITLLGVPNLGSTQTYRCDSKFAENLASFLDIPKTTHGKLK